MKPILVVLAYRPNIGINWIDSHPAIKAKHDWRVIFTSDQLRNYRNVEYIDIGIAKVDRFALTDFKANNREFKGKL